MPRLSGRPPIRIPAALIASIVALILVAVVIIAGASTTMTRIEPGYLGVIVNNITGGIETQSQPGVVYHLPFGMTDVYTIDSRVQTYTMSDKPQPAEPQASRGLVDEFTEFASGRTKSVTRAASTGKVKVKTSDGGDMSMDLTINYKVDETRGELLAKSLGAGEAYKQQILRSYARSKTRDALGRLTIVDIARAERRNEVLVEVQKMLGEDLGKWGIDVLAVSASDFEYNPRYEELIRQRKQFDQDLVNQASEQETARREQVTSLNEAERKKNVELLRIDGQIKKQIIAAEGDATQQKKAAEGEAYRSRKQGDQEFEVAKAEAEALESEGLKRATGVRALSDAYASGGRSLVLEALAKKYAGAKIRGRPYDLSSEVERFRIEDDSGPEAAGRSDAARVAPAARVGER
jgi:regulator of protease activity HflC (stomatin/prohibitin superfamily)